MSFRVEKKILINNLNLFDFRKKIHSLGVKPLFEKRKVHSLYFDNFFKKMYEDSIEGLTPRKNKRRNYPESDSDIFQFETKYQVLREDIKK